MDRDNLIILTFSIFTNICYSVILYAIKTFGYTGIYYVYFMGVYYASYLLASLLFGNIEVNKRNYIMYTFLGMMSTLIAFFFLLYPKNFNYILLATVSSFFIGTAPVFAIIRVKRDIRLYYYFTLYGTIGFIIAQILLFLRINFELLMISLFFSFFALIIFLFSFYFKKILNFLISSIKENYGILGTIERFVDYIEIKEEEFLFKFVGKPSIISLINFIAGMIFSIFWIILIEKSSAYNTYYPIFLLVNSFFTILLYKYLKKITKFTLMIPGIIIRMLAIITLLYIIFYSLHDLYLYIVLYALSGVSWAEFTFYMDNYILSKKPEEYGYVNFFRNLSSVISAVIVGIFGVYYSISLTFFLFISTLLITLIGIQKKYII